MIVITCRQTRLGIRDRVPATGAYVDGVPATGF
jgi:hypothetical protein